MTYEAIEWFTINLQRLATKGVSSCELGHSQVKLTSSTTVLTVKSGRRACRFQWRVSPSYCEYSRVTYDLLVSNIGGTYDRADQLPSNLGFGHFFGRKSVPSPSGVRCKPSITDAYCKTQGYPANAGSSMICHRRLFDHSLIPDKLHGLPLQPSN